MKKRLLALFLTLALIISAFPIINVVAAPKSQGDSLTFVTKLSKTDVKQGDIVTVTVGMENYSSQDIHAISLFDASISIDTDYFEFVPFEGNEYKGDGGIKVLFQRYSSGASVFGYNEATHTIQASFSDSVQTISKDTMELYAFQLKVKTDLTADAQTELGVTNPQANDGTQAEVVNVPCSATASTLNILVADPVILLNEAGASTSAYKVPVKVTFDKGTAVISKNNATPETIVSGAIVDQIGKYTVTATDAAGNSSSVQFEIAEKQIESISVQEFPKSVTEGMKPDLTNALIQLTYDDASKTSVAITQSMIRYADQVGKQEVLVTYAGKTTTCEIEVLAKVPESLSIVNYPKQKYKVGEAFSIEGGKIQVTYNNGTKGDLVALTMDMIKPSAPEMSVGSRDITINYMGLTATYQYQVEDKSLVGISVTAPTKTTYIEKESFTAEGGKVQLSYDNGTTESIDLTKEMCSGYDMTKLGEQTVFVSYGNFNAQFTVEVKQKSVSKIEMSVLPTETSILEGKEIDPVGGILKVTYNNGETESVNLTRSMISNYNTDLVGEQTVTVTYQNQTTSFKIEVKAKSAVGIEIKKLPDQLTYLSGDSIKTDGMLVCLVYDNGTRFDVKAKDLTLSGYDQDLKGSQKVTVTYGGFTTEFIVEVISRETVDQLVKDIEKIDLDHLTVKDKESVYALRDRYNALSELEKSAVTNLERLEKALRAIENLTDEPSGSLDKPTNDNAEKGNQSNQNTPTTGDVFPVVLFVAVAAAGGVCFIVLKSKKKSR